MLASCSAKPRFSLSSFHHRFVVAHLTGVLIVAAALATAQAAPQPTAKTVYKFKGGADGTAPSGAMALDAAGVLGVPGALYGTTEHGGYTVWPCFNPTPEFSGCGTIYRLQPPTRTRKVWLHEVLHRFTITGPAHDRKNDGTHPKSGVVLDVARKALYGSSGGGQGCPKDIGEDCGAIFELKPPAAKGKPWRYQAIYRFKGGSADGVAPVGDLLLDRGVLYGVTESGGLGPFGHGTVFRLAPPAGTRTTWAQKVLHKFAGGRDGATPRAGVVVGPKGALYGTTNFGGGCKAIPPGCGTVYRVLPPKPGKTAWTEEVIFRFRDAKTGYFPMTGVVVHSNGSVFGTTEYGGKFNAGFLFGLRPPAAASLAPAGPPETKEWLQKMIDANDQKVAALKKVKEENDKKKREEKIRLIKLRKHYGSVYLDNSFNEYFIDAKIFLGFGQVDGLRGLRSEGASGTPVKDPKDGKWYAPCDGCENGRVEQYPPPGEK